jgi:glutamyl/glutaminyl-tRNA synthetase
VDFGDFVVWRGSDKIASYELAVVADDLDMGVTEIVRGKCIVTHIHRQGEKYKHTFHDMRCDSLHLVCM